MGVCKAAALLYYVIKCKSKEVALKIKSKKWKASAPTVRNCSVKQEEKCKDVLYTKTKKY